MLQETRAQTIATLNGAKAKLSSSESISSPFSRISAGLSSKDIGGEEVGWRQRACGEGDQGVSTSISEVVLEMVTTGDGFQSIQPPPLLLPRPITPCLSPRTADRRVTWKPLSLLDSSGDVGDAGGEGGGKQMQQYLIRIE